MRVEYSIGFSADAENLFAPAEKLRHPKVPKCHEVSKSQSLTKSAIVSKCHSAKFSV